MELGPFGRSSATVTLSAHELVLVSNALNEVCNGVPDLDDDSEFATRLGATRDEGRRLLADLQGLIERANRLRE
jgi:hypothetical protein